MARKKITINNVTEELNDARLPASLGSADQVLKMNNGATAIEWGTITIPTYTAGDGIDITDYQVTNTDHVLIPPQATSSNPLADKAFVNSSVQTATANFRGSWDNWAAVPTDSTLYPQDYAGSTTPITNDYIAVIDASDFRVEDPLSGTWRFKYTGLWATEGKNGWIPEYQINREPLTAAQIAALNSGITSEKVGTYDGYASSKENVGNKITSITSSATDTQYPSGAAVYSYTDAKGYVTIGGAQYQITTTSVDPGTGTAGQIIIVTG